MEIEVGNRVVRVIPPPQRVMAFDRLGGRVESRRNLVTADGFGNLGLLSLPADQRAKEQ